MNSEYCFVWNWATVSSLPVALATWRLTHHDDSQRVGSTTTYVFPLPPQAPFPLNVAAYSPLSFASLVPSPSQTHQQAGQREPGLVVLSNTGTLRFWESISLSLAGVDRFKSASLPLHEGELVRSLELLSPTTYLASTSHARIFALSIGSSGGRATVSLRVLERAVGWAGSVWSAVFGSKAVDPRAGILALAVSQPREGESEKTVFAVQEKSVQVWRVPARSEGGERLVAEQDVFGAVLEALAGEKVGNEQWALNKGQVEIVDAAVTACVAMSLAAPHSHVLTLPCFNSDGHLALLVSHVHAVTAEQARSFAIVSLDVAHDQVLVAGLTHLAYQCVSQNISAQIPHVDACSYSAPTLARSRRRNFASARATWHSSSSPTPSSSHHSPTVCLHALRAQNLD